MTVSQQERRDSILSQVYQHGHVEVARLARRLEVSEATVRRDLRSLAQEGRIELTHGGGSVSRSPDYAFMSKAARNMAAKQVIGQLASALIEDGQQIFLDSGTSCFQMAPFLRPKKALSVIVNSIRTAQELFGNGVNVLLLGGQYRPDRMDAVGPMGAASLENLRGYRAFVGTDGVGMDFGPGAIDIESANIFGLAVKNARDAILLADASKFGSPALFRICDWKYISTVVTNVELSGEWMEFFDTENINVVYPADPPEGAADGHTNRG